MNLRGRRIDLKEKIIKILLINLLVLLNLISVINICLADNVQTVNVNRNYKHPVTSEILDPGQNYEIGQGMVEGVVIKEGEIKSENGQLLAIVHFSMMEYLKNIKFSIQEPSEKIYKDTEYEILENNGSIAVFKIPINTVNSIIKVEAYVEPMERNVIFFIDFEGYVSDSVSSLNTNSDINSVDSLEVSNDINNQQQNVIKENNIKEIKKDFEHGLLLKSSEELKQYLNEDNKEKKEEKELKKLGPVTEMFIFSLIIFISVFSAVLAAYSLAIRLKAKRLEKVNRILEEILYEED